MFITIEDETGIANLVLWPSLFEKQRRLVLSAGMIACHGRVQRDGAVVHVVVEHLMDLSRSCARSAPATLPIERGRGDGATHPGSADSRDQVARRTGARATSTSPDEPADQRPHQGADAGLPVSAAASRGQSAGAGSPNRSNPGRSANERTRMPARASRPANSSAAGWRTSRNNRVPPSTWQAACSSSPSSPAASANSRPAAASAPRRVRQGEPAGMQRRAADRPWPERAPHGRRKRRLGQGEPKPNAGEAERLSEGAQYHQARTWDGRRQAALLQIGERLVHDREPADAQAGQRRRGRCRLDCSDARRSGPWPCRRAGRRSFLPPRARPAPRRRRAPHRSATARRPARAAPGAAAGGSAPACPARPPRRPGRPRRMRAPPPPPAPRPPPAPATASAPWPAAAAADTAPG